MVTSVGKKHIGRIILRPNRSASWNQTKTLAIVLGIIVLTIALGWSFAGAWLILPFAGLEVGLLGFFLYRVNRDTFHQQIIDFAPESITLSFGNAKPEQVLTFSRPTTYLLVLEPPPGEDKIRLFIWAQGSEQEVGQFLTQEDRALARRHMSDMGLIECNRQWWRQSAD